MSVLSSKLILTFTISFSLLIEFCVITCSQLQCIRSHIISMHSIYRKMQSCDCFERYDSRKAHCDRKSPFTCKSDVKKSKSHSFSIDAILSKPGKVFDGENLSRASPSSPTGKRYGTKSCYFEACHPHSRQMQVHSCCQKSYYHQPPHRLDYLSFFRYPRFVDEDANELPRRCHDEPATMVQVGKHGYPVSCPGCPDCSLSFQRLHRG